MAEHRNVARIKDGYAAFAKGDFAALNDLFAEDPSPKTLRIVSSAIARGSVASAVPTLSRPVISSPTKG